MRLASPALAAVLFSLAMAQVQAEQIIQTQGFMGNPNFVQQLEFDRFNPSKGTLNSIEVRVDLIIDGGSLSVDNDGLLPANLDVELGATAALSSAGVRLLDSGFMPILSGTNAVGVSTGSSFILAPENGDGATFDPTGPDGATHLGGIASAFDSAFVNPSFFTDYMGTTMYDMQVAVNQLLDFGGQGGLSGQFDPVNTEVMVTVTYDFSQQVPEPATLTSAALGLLGLAGFARKSRRRS